MLGEVVHTIVEALRLPIKYLSLLSVLFPLCLGIIFFARSEKWQKVLFAYIILSALAELVSLLTINTNRPVFFLTQNLFTVGECIILLTFYHAVFEFKLISRIFMVASAIYICFAAVSLSFSGMFISNNVISTVEALLLISCALTYPVVAGFNARTIVISVDFVILIYFATNFITFKYEKEIEADTELRRLIFSLQRLINIMLNVIIGLSLKPRKINGIPN